MSYKKALTNQSKLSRIMQYTPDVKRFYFINSKHRSGEYEKFMQGLTLFPISEKTCMKMRPMPAMLVDFISGGVKKVTVARRLF